MDQQNNVVEKERNIKVPVWQNILNWTFRLLVGCLFIYSGFVKGVDPWGTIYKVTEYLTALNLSIPDGIVYAGVFILIGYEFLTGIFILTGSYRKSAPIMAILLMAVMLPLTLWIAVSNPVSDCGCFGDALKISNWATFWKNVLLTLAIIWLIKFNKRSGSLITPALQWLGFVVSGAYIMFIGLVGYISQPLIDFRSYPVGSELAGSDVDINSDGDSQFLFRYKKGDQIKEFTENDELPDEEDGWSFVERVMINDSSVDSSKSKSEKTADSDFAIYDTASNEDITKNVLNSGEDYLIAVMPEMEKVSASSAWMLNTLAQWGNQNNVELIAVIAGSDKALEKWEDLAMPDYAIYRSDDTMIKEVARGNPGIIYVEKGIIKWKNSLRALPIDETVDENLKQDYRLAVYEPRDVLNKSTGCYIAVLFVLMALSLTTKFKRRNLKHIHSSKTYPKMCKKQE